MQTDSIYLSNDEDTATQYLMSDQVLSNDSDEQRLNQFVIQPKDTTDTFQVTILTYNVNIRTLSSPTTNEPQRNKHKNNVSSATTEYNFKSGPVLIELGQVPLTRDSPESFTPSKKETEKLVMRQELHDTPPLPNDPELLNINDVRHELKELAHHTYSELENQTSGCFARGKLFDQVFGETAADYLQLRAETRQTTRQRRIEEKFSWLDCRAE